jgi:two-component system OmpR family response regulator
MSSHERKPRILIVEDETAIARGLEFNFEQEGYEPVVMGDGPSTLKYLDEHEGEVDAVVLDLMLPGMSGYEICKEIRQRDGSLPIMVLSARSLSEDRAYAFDCGTDQYMTKPFALPELLSRMRNLLARKERLIPPRSANERSVGETFQFGDVEVDFRAFQLKRGDDVTSLTTMETALLRYFIEHEGAVLSRQQILKHVWEQQADITTRTIDNFVLRLRRYIEDDPARPRHLLSVRGTGYRFVAAAEAGGESDV